MTRGLGTSLGLSLTGLVFAVVAGSHAEPSLVAGGFTAACLFLAAVAVAAALLAALRGDDSDASGLLPVRVFDGEPTWLAGSEGA